jgi:UDP-N-acetyl-D-mannosaminuronic acid dehydrogenase
VWVTEKIKAAIVDVLSKKPDARMSDVKVACLGLAFKPNIDDLRESPAVEVAKQITKIGCQVLAVEPNIEQLPVRLTDGMTLVSLDAALDQADVLCVLVKHQPFVLAVDEIRKHESAVDVVGLFAT